MYDFMHSLTAYLLLLCCLLLWYIIYTSCCFFLYNFCVFVFLCKIWGFALLNPFQGSRAFSGPILFSLNKLASKTSIIVIVFIPCVIVFIPWSCVVVLRQFRGAPTLRWFFYITEKKVKWRLPENFHPKKSVSIQ